ncbi:hypothetical protein K488DRAFT_67289 [Vararia minispora EC-137]|uniref:Uncharacterized protein n=1 Tax=Vararia minispora EC-137 TaxID=1314806 RepID=A0ACB8R045_9AGAM|nr:hypothetical protein K488DRAFT_67289 [Vararia minispora EC-137]
MPPLRPSWIFLVAAVVSTISFATTACGLPTASRTRPPGSFPLDADGARHLMVSGPVLDTRVASALGDAKIGAAKHPWRSALLRYPTSVSVDSTEPWIALISCATASPDTLERARKQGAVLDWDACEAPAWEEASSCVVRAVRHPERYASAEGGFTGGPGGTLTRAILDTFPVIKFHSGGVERPRSTATTDADAAEKAAHEMDVFDDDRKAPPLDEEHTLPPLPATQEAEQPIASPSSMQAAAEIPSVRAREPVATEVSDPMPDQIGRETCPICIVDFEEGDDLRVLPCEGQHQFHQACVDPWLLELSTSCPICRQDFQALQDIISGETEDGHGYESGAEARRSRNSSYGRFSRYLRFARRRQHGDDFDATNPPMPTAPDSSY